MLRIVLFICLQIIPAFCFSQEHQEQKKVKNSIYLGLGKGFLTSGDWTPYRLELGLNRNWQNDKWFSMYSVVIAYEDIASSFLPSYNENSSLISADQTNLDSYIFTEVSDDINYNRLYNSSTDMMFLARAGWHLGRNFELKNWKKFNLKASLGIEVNYHKRLDIVESFDAVVSQTDQLEENTRVRIYTPFYHRGLNLGLALRTELNYRIQDQHFAFLSFAFRREQELSMAVGYALGYRYNL